jgi:hypothetical protein
MYRIVKVTTTTPNEDLLQNATVKASIMERLGITEASDYVAIFVVGPNGEKKGIDMIFDAIFDADNQISINGDIYNDLIEGIAYSSGTNHKVTTLRVKTAGTVTLNYDILR